MKKFLLLLVFLLVFSCGNKGIPKDIIPQKEMIAIMVDLSIVNEYFRNPVRKKYKKSDFYSKIFKQYNTTDSIFRRSNDYYMNNQEAIYNEILSQSRDSVKSIRKTIK